MKRTLIYLLLAACLPVMVTAQSASERRAARQKNETNAKEFEADDPLFKSAEVPEKWANRSAIIIGERVEFNFGGNSGSEVSLKLRRQVKLLDQAAVEEFGSYVYDEDEDNRTGIQIIKADGKRVVIDMATAALYKEEATNSRVRQWNNYVRGGKNRRKVALPGLQVGDIVDMIFESKGNLQVIFYPSCSDVLDISFADDYPILRKNVQFTVRRGTAVSAIAMNGAPKLNLVSEAGGRFQTYVASGEMFEDDTLSSRYAFNHRIQPRIKFQVCITGGKESTWDEFAGEPGEVKKSVTADEIQTVIANAFKYRQMNRSVSYGRTTYSRYYSNQIGWGYIKEYSSWLGRYYRTETNPVKVADLLYYRMRYDFMYGQYVDNAKYMNDELFAAIFIGTLKERNKDWNVQLIVAPGRNFTERKYLMSRDEMYWASCVTYKGDKHLYYGLSNHRRPGDSFYRLAGVEGQVVYTDKKEAKGASIQKFRFPEEKAEDHGMNYSADISLNANNELKFAAKTSYRGNSRFNATDYFLSNMDFSKDEEALVQSMSKEEKKKSASENRRQKKEEVGKTFDKEENEKKKIERLKKRVENGYTLVSYDGYEVLTTGRMPNEKEMIVSEKYTVSDLVSKAGRNLIVSVGLFPGEYSRIDTSLKRVFDISYDFPATYKMEYRLQIPEGYQAEGVEALNTEVSNSTGRFKTTALVEGGILKLTVERVYLRAEMPVSDWADFTRFVNAASDFNQKKVVLKKI